MTTKELAIQAISRLPDSADWMQIEERIHFAEFPFSGRVVPELRDDRIRDVK